MRVIICGAGQVGYNIASYLSRENNDVTVVDSDAEMIARINHDLDANSLLGSGSSPEVLEAAGANEADMIIAVTHQDEVNMVACQVAHSLFGVPKKIARIRDQVFRDPVWANLFSRSHMPIDVIISPEIEVAKAVELRLAVPGTTTVMPMAAGETYVCGVMCEDDCPIVNTPLRQLAALFPDNRIRILTIVRNGRPIIPKPDDQMLVGDEVFFISEKSQIPRILTGFGHEEQKARHVILIGGGNIGASLIERIKDKHKDVNLKVIENNSDRAEFLSQKFDDVVILNASGLDRQVLEEANIMEAETIITVTDDDETNILASLLARQYGCGRVIPLVNREAYNSLTASLGIGSVVSPKAITAATVMRHVRRGRIRAVHNLLSDFGEILEIEASDTLEILNTPLREIDWPRGVLVCAIVRGDRVIMPDANTVIKPNDHVIILATQGKAQKIEKMFSAPVDLF